MDRDQIEKAIAGAETFAVKMAQDFAAGTITATQFSSQLDDHKAAMARLRVMLRDAVTNPPTKPAPQLEPAKPRFAVGQKVRIVGPWFGCGSGCFEIGQAGDLFRIRHKDNDSKKEPAYDVKVGNNLSFSYPASSLVPIAEVPAPRFKRGDKVNFPAGVGTVAAIKYRPSSHLGTWFYSVNDSSLFFMESGISPAPAEPVYLPTRYIYIDSDKDHDGHFDSGFATQENTDDHTHVIHDMPADENGVQVDFVTLTEAGYAVSRNVSDTFSWRPATKLVWEFGGKTAIDAWRAAARHYLANREKK